MSWLGDRALIALLPLRSRRFATLAFQCCSEFFYIFKEKFFVFLKKNKKLLFNLPESKKQTFFFPQGHGSFPFLGNGFCGRHFIND
jgi:hypothetical protein